MFNKIKCMILGHKYIKFEVGYQALNSEGIAYQTVCERCPTRATANFNYNVNPNEFKDKKLLSKYVAKFGHTY